MTKFLDILAGVLFFWNRGGICGVGETIIVNGKKVNIIRRKKEN